MSKRNKKQKGVHQDSKCIELHVNGMHCAACELVIEKKLAKYDGVKKVDAVLSDNKVKIWGVFDESEHALAQQMTKLIENDGYTLATEKGKKQVNWGEFKIALPVAAVIIFLFLLLQELGIVNLVNPETINLPAVFMIGIVASLSSCMAVVGGLVLSISANYAKEESQKEARGAMVMFHVARLLGFFVLGGAIGLIGSAFKLSSTATFVMSLLVGFVMVILGLNLLDIFEFTKKLQLKMPKSLARTAVNTENMQNKWTPILLGVVTFFLPCGFTQSMQIYSLSSGSFIQGALTMLVFALGTLPVLALISFASNKMVGQKQTSGVFFKVAGLIVLFFALINVIGALVAIGFIEPVFNF
jgi:sulfite exporter TauE/SafE/copper chaperone CopZ